MVVYCNNCYKKLKKSEGRQNIVGRYSGDNYCKKCEKDLSKLKKSK